MAKNQALTVEVLREELEKQGSSTKYELRKEFKEELSKQEKKFEGFVKEESKKYRRQMHFLDGRFQKRQELMAEAIGELKESLDNVKTDVGFIKEDVEYIKLDINLIRHDLKTKVSRDELVPEAFVGKQ